MADNSWAVVVGTAIGALGGVIPAVVKHFSDVHQRKLERRFKLEDDSWTESKRRSDVEEANIALVRKDATDLFALKEKMTIASSPEAVKELWLLMLDFFERHPQYRCAPENAEVFRSFPTETMNNHLGATGTPIAHDYATRIKEASQRLRVPSLEDIERFLQEQVPITKPKTFDSSAWEKPRR